MKVKRYLLLLVLGGIIGGFVGSSMEVLVLFYQMLILHISILVNHLYHCIANYHWSYILFVESSKRCA